MKSYYEIKEIDGKKAIHLFNESWYHINEKLYPSVTFILNVHTPKQLGYWFKQVGMNADLIVKRAKEIGSEFHRIVELFLKGNYVDYNMVNPEYLLEVWTRFNNFYEFYNKHLRDCEILDVEKQVFHEEIGYAGTLDLITRHDDGLRIWDWKTGSAIHEGNKCQISAYAYALDEPPKECNVVIFPESPKTKQGYTITTLDNNQIDSFFELFIWYKKEFDRTTKEPLFKTLPTKFERD